MLNLVLALKLLACTPIQPLGIRFFSIPTMSMEPTLRRGAMVAVDRCSYGLSRYSYDWFELPLHRRWPPLLPARGDVVVFRTPADTTVFYVKRVIGLPGDRVELRDGRIVLNGIPVARRAEKGSAFVETLPAGASYRVVLTGAADAPLRTVAAVVVPAGHLYLLGDNRDNSLDSRGAGATRWSSAGTIPVEHVFGRVQAIGSWPLDRLKPALQAMSGRSDSP